MYKQRLSELARLRNLFGRDSYLSYSKPLYESLIKEGLLDKFNPYVDYTWDDSSRIAGYVDYVTRKVSKYCLHYGMINQLKFHDYKNQIQQDEDKLVDYLVYEMRKAPVEKQYPAFKI